MGADQRDTAPIVKDVRIRIRTPRKAKRWNQDDVALHGVFGRTYISNFERRRKSPSLRILEVLAVGLKMSLTQFLEDL